MRNTFNKYLDRGYDMKDYYQQLEPIVLANLMTNLSDLTEVDYDSLAHYAGDFLHAHNDSSTSLILLDSPAYLDSQLKDQAESDFFKNRNTVYILGSEGRLRQISKKHARKIWQGYSNKFTQDIKSYIATNQAMRMHVN